MAATSIPGLAAAAALLSILLYHLLPTADAELVQCLKDEAMGEREGNTYYCGEDVDRPECCTKEAQPTCCEPETTRNLKEQLQLWGTVGAILVIVGVLVFCIRSDINYCAGETPLSERIRNKFSRKKPVDKKLGNFTKVDEPSTSKSRPSSSSTNDGSTWSNNSDQVNPGTSR